MFYHEITDCSSASDCAKCGTTANQCAECNEGFVIDGNDDCSGK